MKKLALSIALIFSFQLIQAQTNRALIIGIGNYPSETGWAQIHGDNDVPIITESLVEIGFNKGNIKTLTNSEATKSDIVTGLKNLMSTSQKNDNIYIHFSTHGQQVIDGNGDEEDGFDEAIIPYDAIKEYKKGSYSGENHLTDDELNIYLSSIKKAIGENGNLMVIIDACHSGGGTRSEEDSVITRGTSAKFNHSIKVVGSKKQLKLNWVAISASQSYQTNYEYRFNGTYYGSLSYALKLAFGELTKNETMEEFFTIIEQKREQMKVSKYPQTPSLEGENMYLQKKIF